MKWNYAAASFLVLHKAVKKWPQREHALKISQKMNTGKLIVNTEHKFKDIWEVLNTKTELF